MERRAKIDAGAYVYFTFLRPFAELAGVDLDWTVPRDSMDLYPLLELIDGALPGRRRGRDRRHVLLRRFRDARRGRRACARAGRRTRGGGRRGISTSRPTTASGSRCGSRARPRSASRGGGRTCCCPIVAGPGRRARSRGRLAAPGSRDPRRRAVGRADVRDAVRALDVRARSVRRAARRSRRLAARRDRRADAGRARHRVGGRCRRERSARAPTRRVRRLRAVRRRARRGAARPVALRARRGRPAVAHVGRAALRSAGARRRGCTRRRSR